jgi:hypothetical protein
MKRLQRVPARAPAGANGDANADAVVSGSVVVGIVAVQVNMVRAGRFRA